LVDSNPGYLSGIWWNAWYDGKLVDSVAKLPKWYRTGPSIQLGDFQKRQKLITFCSFKEEDHGPDTETELGLKRGHRSPIHDPHCGDFLLYFPLWLLSGKLPI
jgi:hypothetical protein